jgi:hypothetical protein
MTMTVERFADLAEIYGGDVARWPEAEREIARALLAAEPVRLEAVLADAARLDRLLDLAPAQSADAALLGRLIAAAPRPASTVQRWLAGAGAALGLGVAALAGVAVGVMIGQVDHRPAPQGQSVIATDFTADLSEALQEPAAL